MTNLHEEVEKILLSHYNGIKLEQIVKDMRQDVGVLVLNNIRAKKEIIEAITTWALEMVGSEPDCLLPQTEKNIIKYKMVAIRNGLRYEIRQRITQSLGEGI